MFWGKKQWRNTHKFCAYVRTYVRLQCHKYAVPSPVKGKKPWIFLVQNCEKLLSHTRTHILIRGVKGAVLGTKQHRVELYTLTRSQRYRLYCALLESSSILMSTSPQGIKRSTGVAANHSAVYAAAVVVVCSRFVCTLQRGHTNAQTLMLLNSKHTHVDAATADSGRTSHRECLSAAALLCLCKHGTASSVPQT